MMHFQPAFLFYELYKGKAKILSSAGTELAIAISEAIFKITHSMFTLRKHDFFFDVVSKKTTTKNCAINISESTYESILY